jgi:hypothetical protein
VVFCDGNRPARSLDYDPARVLELGRMILAEQRVLVQN